MFSIPFRSRTLATVAVAFALLVASPIFAQQAPVAPLTAEPDEVVIAFDDITITRAEFDEAFDVAARTTAIGQGLPVTDEVLDEFEPFRAEFLEQYATQRVLAAAAEQRGLAADDATVDAVVDELRQEQLDDGAFGAWLETAGYDDEQRLREMLGINLSVQALVDELALAIDIDPSDVAAWYEANPDVVTDEGGSMVPLAEVEEEIAQLLLQEALIAEVGAITASAGLELFPSGR